MLAFLEKCSTVKGYIQDKPLATNSSCTDDSKIWWRLLNPVEILSKTSYNRYNLGLKMNMKIWISVILLGLRLRKETLSITNFNNSYCAVENCQVTGKWVCSVAKKRCSWKIGTCSIAKIGAPGKSVSVRWTHKWAPGRFVSVRWTHKASWKNPEKGAPGKSVHVR